MNFQEKYTKIHKGTLSLYATLSKANRLKCSSILVSSDNTRILAVGYNGTPSGTDNTCEYIGYKCNTCDKEIFYDDSYTENKNICKICLNELTDIVYKTKPIVVHAEANLVSYCAKKGISMENNLVYITHSPCVECAKLLVSSGISKIFYIDEYRSDEGLKLLTLCNVPYEKI